MLPRHKGAKKLTQVVPSLRALIGFFGIGTGTALTRPIGNICAYSPHRKHFLPLDKECFGSTAALHRTQKKRFSFSRSRAYSCCWAEFSFSTSCFTIPIHPSQFHRCLN